MAKDAKKVLHKKELEGRLISIFDENEGFMKRVCCLNWEKKLKNHIY